MLKVEKSNKLSVVENDPEHPIPLDSLVIESTSSAIVCKEPNLRKKE